MVDFACKKFNIEEIIKCSLGLSKSEFYLLKFLLKNDDYFSTDVLAKRLDFDKSTIQRGVKRLHEKDLVKRSQENKSKGGYVFYYKVKDKACIRNNIIKIIDGWTTGVKKEVSNW